MKRTTLFLAIACLLAGCAAPAVNTPAPTASPTHTPVPRPATRTPTPIETPNPYANIDAQNINTWPDSIKTPWQTGTYPDVATQETNHTIYMQMYKNLLNKYAEKYGYKADQINNWFQNDHNMLTFKAGEIALQEGFYLPMDPVITRNMDAGIQGIAYPNDQNNSHFGIFKDLARDKKDEQSLLYDQNYTIAVFNKDVVFKRAPYTKAVAREIIPVQWANNKYGLILHYTDDNNQDCYFPLRIYLNTINTNDTFDKMVGFDAASLKNFIKSIEPPFSAPLIKPGFRDENHYTLISLLVALKNAETVQIISMGNDERGYTITNVISNEGLEVAGVIIITQPISPPPTPSPVTPTP